MDIDKKDKDELNKPQEEDGDKVEEETGKKEDDVEEDKQESEDQDEKDKESEEDESEVEKEEEETEERKEDEAEEESEEESETQKQEIRFRGFNPNEEKDDTYETNYPPRKKGMKKFIIWLSFLALLALVIGWLATSVIFKGEEEEKITEEAPSPTPTSTPLSQTTLKRSEWNLEVLNGSGVSGLAKKIAEELESLGYKVIKVGNADKSDYEKTQIFIRDNLKDQVDKVIADIGDIIKVASVGGELKDSTASAQIIIGKDTP